MPAFDANLMFRTTGDLTVSESNGPLTIRGTGIKGMAARVIVPINPDTSTATTGWATILPRYWVSDDGTTFRLAFTYPGGAHAQLPRASLELITPIVGTFKYITEELVLGASSIIGGAVQSGIVTGVGFDWDRAVHFE